MELKQLNKELDRLFDVIGCVQSEMASLQLQIIQCGKKIRNFGNIWEVVVMSSCCINNVDGRCTHAKGGVYCALKTCPRRKDV